VWVGDASSLKLAKPTMAQSAMDAGWGKLKTITGRSSISDTMGTQPKNHERRTLMPDHAHQPFQGMLFRSLYPELSKEESIALEIDGSAGSDELDKLMVMLCQTRSVDLLFESRPDHHTLTTLELHQGKQIRGIRVERERALIAAIYQAAATSMRVPFSQVRAGEKSFRTPLSNGTEALIRFCVCPTYPSGFDLSCKVFTKG